MSDASGRGDGPEDPDGGPSADAPASRPDSPPVGLCAACRHARRVTSDRGSTFVLCRLSGRNPDYPRYPRLPVLRCAGYEEAAPDGAGEGS